jgi:hypothetical protein
MDLQSRRPGLGTLAAAGALVAAFAVSTSPSAGATAVPCQRVRIGTHVVCIAAGRRSDPRYGHVYKRYEFSCTRRADGHYRFHALSYIARPNP